MQENLSALPNGYRLQEYEIISVLGVGGFGITYLANDTQLGMRVAIKEYLPNSLAVRSDNSTVYPKSKPDEESYRWGLDRFLKEAQTLARFRHPNIVRVLRFFEANGTGYTVMEYEEGQSLADFLRTHPAPLSEKFLLTLLIPLMDGLRLVHKEGFLHRDIKPANIYLRKGGSPVLLDFGSARLALGTHTQNLTSVFTPGYAPFEQYFNEGKQGPWTDIYALGAILYRAVTGNPPPDAAKRVKNDTMVSASVFCKGQLSAKFLQSIDRALLMDEEARPQTIEAWQSMLTSATQGSGKQTTQGGGHTDASTLAFPGTVPAKTLKPPAHPTGNDFLPTVPAAQEPPAQPPETKRFSAKVLLLILLATVAVGGVSKHWKKPPADDPSATLGPQASTEPTFPEDAAAVRKIEKRFARADTNGDGFLSREETAAEFPLLARNFERVDQDHDGRLSLTEVVSAFEARWKKTQESRQ